MENQEALLEAARVGDVERIGELLDADPDLLNARNELGQGGVLLAKYHRQDEVVGLLLGRGAELNVWEAAAVGNSARVMALLEADEKLLNRHSKDGFTPLGLAAFFGNHMVVQNLLAREADPNLAASNPMAVAPIHSAVASGQLEIVRMLVEAGATVNAAQQQGFTPLHGAAHAGNEKLVGYLLAEGADAGSRTTNGQTAADLAMTQGHQRMVQLLEKA